MRKIALPAAFGLAALVVVGWLASCKGNSTNPITTPGELASPTIAATGGVFLHTFSTQGNFPFHCTIHPSCTTLQGHIIVVDPSIPIPSKTLSITFAGGTAGYTCSALSVQTDTVHVGDTITWTNNSPLPHTVTSF